MEIELLITDYEDNNAVEIMAFDSWEDAESEIIERIDDEIDVLVGHVSSRELRAFESNAENAKEEMYNTGECEFYGKHYLIRYSND